MAGREKDGTAWQETTVLLRADIHRLAIERGIDIKDTCNRALAAATGTAYPEQRQENATELLPVIVVKDGAVPHPAAGIKKTQARKTQPVINADDPSAPAKVAETKAAGTTPAEPVPEPPVPGQQPGAEPLTKRSKVPAQCTRKKKQAVPEVLKTFLESRITRTADVSDHIGKDEFYTLFTRFCHEHHVSPVPERRAVTASLKNRFALNEHVVGGIPSWTGIRISR